MPHRGLEDTSVFAWLRYASRRMILETYIGLQIAATPVTRKSPLLQRRNAEIRERYRAGEPLYELADVFGISQQRVHQIIQGKRQ